MCSSIFSKEVVQHDVEKHNDMRTCTRFVQSTLRKIFTVVATRYFGWASPQTPLGELIVLPQTTYLDLRGPTSKEREGKERLRKGKRQEGEERMCAVGIFNYFRLCNRPISGGCKIAQWLFHPIQPAF